MVLNGASNLRKSVHMFEMIITLNNLRIFEMKGNAQ